MWQQIKGHKYQDNITIDSYCIKQWCLHTLTSCDMTVADSSGAHPARAPLKGPNYFVLTYKFYET